MIIFQLDTIWLLIVDVKLDSLAHFKIVATFTDYEGIDPEIYGGIDNNFYPRPQTGVFGVTFEF